MPAFDVHPIDIAILLAYVVGTRIVLGWYFARRTFREGGTESYFLAGRRLRWPIIGLSFYVANMSGSTFVALPASGYQNGIAVYNYEWLPAFILVFFAAVILPFYLRERVYTAPQYLEKRYGRRPRLIFTVFLLLANIFIDAAAALYAGAIVMQVLFPDIPLWVTIAVTAAAAGVYIAFGGLGAVVFNDAIQATLILLGGSAIALLAWDAVPSWEAVRQSAPPGGLSLFLPADDPVLPWPGMLTGVLIIGVYFWCTNQFMIQRALGAHSLEDGRRGALFAGLLKLPNLFILILPGVMATALYPGLDNPDLVFPVMVFDLLPIGVRGLLLAALAAAILSSLEAILNSAATLFTMDLVRGLRPDLGEDRLVRIGRASTLAFMLLSAAWAPQIAHFPTLWQYLQSVLAYVTPPIVAVFLFGFFTTRAGATAATATLLIGWTTGVAGWIGIEIMQLVRLQYLYACGILFALCCALMAVLSLPAPSSVQHARPSLRELSRPSRPHAWWGDYRIQAAALLAVTAGVVGWWG